MQTIIEINGLTKYYQKSLIGIDNLNLEVQEGEIFGFLGSNGAGKTTTIRLLINLLFPTSGSAKIFGLDMVKDHLQICKDIGYIPSSIRPHKQMTGYEFLKYLGTLSANGRCHREYQQYLLDRFTLSTKDLHRKIKDYSSGMARKIALIQAFQHRPRLLIMDEPTEGLDPVMQETFYQLLKEYRDKGGTVFLSSHHLREVELICQRAAIIRQGRLMAVEVIQDRLKCSGRSIYVTFQQPVPLEQLKCPAWEITHLDGCQMSARLTGEMDTVIKFLAGFPIQNLNLPNTSLQDIFLNYYREETN